MAAQRPSCFTSESVVSSCGGAGGGFVGWLISKQGHPESFDSPASLAGARSLELQRALAHFDGRRLPPSLRIAPEDPPANTLSFGQRCGLGQRQRATGA